MNDVVKDFVAGWFGGKLYFSRWRYILSATT